jgi:hypothetical protein
MRRLRRKRYEVLQIDHGAGVTYEPSTVDELVAAGRMDPEFERMDFRKVEGIIRASAGAPLEVRAAPYAGAVTNPLGPPTISGTTFSIDIALQQPTRVITPMVLDITRQRFFVDRVFASAGGVTGGAVVYDVVVQPDLYADRDIQRVEPGSEFPIIAFSRRAPQAAVVEKWGGKFYFLDEARDRNLTTEFTRAVRQLSNTIVRKINQRGVQILNAFVTSAARTVTGNDWSAVNTTYAGGSNWPLFPARDFAKADWVAEKEEMYMDYNLWIINADEMFNLEGVYGDKLGALLDSYNVDIFVTNRIPSGEAFAVAEGQVGEMRVEQPLTTETWRDPNGKQATWVQSSVRPLMYANNGFAVLHYTGLGSSGQSLPS